MIETDILKPMAAHAEDTTELDPIRREAYAWIVRCMTEGVTPANSEGVKAWYAQSPAHAEAYAEARRLWQALGQVASAHVQDGRSLSPRPSMSPSLARRAFLGGTIAASAAAVAAIVVRPPLGLWPSLTDLTAELRTGAGERRQVALGGGLALDLSSKTSVAILGRTAEATRLEMTAGETTISVSASAPPVMLIAEGGKVVARLAEFNVRCDESTVAVSCLKGKVKVEVERKGVAVVLSAGEQLVFGERGVGAVRMMNPEAVTAWRRGLLVFESTPVARIIDEVNRYLPGRIMLLNEELGQRRMTARLPVAEASRIVVQIEHIFGAKVTTLPGSIILLS